MASAAIGIDVGGTKMLFGVVDDSSHVLHAAERPTFGLGADELIESLAAGLTDARDAARAPVAVGIGLPCRIDRARGVAIAAVNLPIVDLPIREMMAERSGLPVFIDNDANVAIIGEHRFGAARGARNAVMLTIGTGVGGGLILDGNPYRGSTGAGAELGHIVIDMDGPPCQGSCPSNGCIETMVSGTAMAREGRAAAEGAPDSALGRLLAAGEQITGRSVVEAAAGGDQAAHAVVAEIGRRLGIALASLANVFEPDVMIVGGGVLSAGEMLLGPARAELERRALNPMNQVPVVPAALGAEAGMIGAAAMAMSEMGM